MTERKPPGISVESWVERQIREAAERGEFEDLPGAGKPLPGENHPYDENWWVRRKMAREQVSFLPPSLALRKEAEDARDAALSARSEREARRIITDINEKIHAALRMPPEGPPLRLSPYDPDEIAREWHERRARRA